MSAIIAVCGNNFCSFIADTRRVVSSGDRFLFGDDDTQKIFKLNSNVLYGMTGLYDTHSSILAAVSAIQDLSHACVDDVKDCVLDYIEAHKYAIIKRNTWSAAICRTELSASMRYALIPRRSAPM